MRRKKVWMAMLGSLLSAGSVLAQGPTSESGGMQNPFLQRLGSGHGIVPALPGGGTGLRLVDGGSTPAPAVKPAPQSPPVTQPKAAPQPQPDAQPMLVPMHAMEVGPVCEPYTLYEGCRYLAEVKLDHTRCWVQANYIHWWIQRDNTPPLVTTGTPGPGAGTIGVGDTSVILGDGAIGPKEFSGMQVTIGSWLDEERLQSFEITGFWLGSNSRQYRFASDAQGNPVLAQPVQTPAETALLTSFPGAFAGDILVNSFMEMHGVEINMARNLYRLNCWSIDTLAGFRYMYLNDSLSMHQNITVLPGAAIPFNGVDQGAGSHFFLADSFDATNRFYGGQVGARVNFTCCRWDLGSTFKLGFGATTHDVVIDGSTQLTTAGGVTSVAPGSSLAQASNIGHHRETDLSIVPEFNVTVGYQIHCNIRLIAGYNALYWNNIVRAANQIDRRIDLTQSPTDPGFIPNRVGSAPSFPNSRSDFWAHGLNLGMELRW